MKSVAEAIEARVARGKLGAAVRLVESAGGELVRVFKEHVLQGVVERSVRVALGRARGVRPRELTPWACPDCGPRAGDQVRRNGHYRRRPLTCEGVISLRIPQLVCIDCRRSVPYSHPLLPRRRRLWLDIEHRLVLLYLEGMSYRAARRVLEWGARTRLGLMTLWRTLQRVAEGPHAPPPRLPSAYLGVDEVYHRLRGTPAWFLVVRGQAADGSKHYLGAALSSERSREAWEYVFDELGVSRYHPPFAVLSDGDRAIEEAVLRCLPGVELRRCTWHLKHNAAGWIRERHPTVEEEGRRHGLRAAVDAIVDAPSLQERRDSLRLLEPAAPWLVRQLEPILERIPPKTPGVIRTNNLMERGFRELRRRTRPMDGFKSARGASNFHTLWMLKENARCNGRDYLPELIP